MPRPFVRVTARSAWASWSMWPDQHTFFEQDTAIEILILKIHLDADEAAEALKAIRLHVFQGEPGCVIRILGPDPGRRTRK